MNKSAFVLIKVEPPTDRKNNNVSYCILIMKVSKTSNDTLSLRADHNALQNETFLNIITILIMPQSLKKQKRFLVLSPSVFWEKHVGVANSITDDALCSTLKIEF